MRGNKRRRGRERRQSGNYFFFYPKCVWRTLYYMRLPPLRLFLSVLHFSTPHTFLCRSKWRKEKGRERTDRVSELFLFKLCVTNCMLYEITPLPASCFHSSCIPLPLHFCVQSFSVITSSLIQFYYFFTLVSELILTSTFTTLNYFNCLFLILLNFSFLLHFFFCLLFIVIIFLNNLLLRLF